MAQDFKKEISFQAGELSPLFYGRSETEFYQKGLAVAENVRIDKRGGAFRRGGLEQRVALASGISYCLTKQIHPWRFDTLLITSSDDFGDYLYKIGSDRAFGTANLLGNGKFDAGSSGWSTFTPGSGSRILFNRKTCRMRPAQDPVQLCQIRRAAAIASPTSEHTIRVEQVGSKVLGVYIGTTAGASDILSTATNKEHSTFTFTPGAGNTTIHCTLEADGTFETENIITFVGIQLSTEVDDYTGTRELVPWDEQDIDELHIIESPDGQAIYYLHPNFAPRKRPARHRAWRALRHTPK